MLYLNLLNRLFGKSKGVSREEMEAYSTTKDTALKQEVEEKALIDDFENEAFEGWKNHNVKATMNRLDKKLNYNTEKNILKNAIKWSVIVLLFGFTSIVLLINWFNKETSTYTAKVNNTTETEIIERTKDSIFERELEPLVLKTEEKQLKSTDLKTIQAPLIKKERVDTVQPTNNYKTLNNLELEIKPVIPELKKENLFYTFKKEIYLHNLKAIDYTIYRSKPIETERMVLSGITADKANKDDESETITWEKVDVPYIEYLDRSMELFEDGKFKKALVRFKQILVFYPEDVNAHFYSGLCYYNLNKNELALNAFAKSYSFEYGNFREEAEWLSYLVYKDQGSIKQAKILCNKIIEEGGYYAGRAKNEKL